MTKTISKFLFIALVISTTSFAQEKNIPTYKVGVEGIYFLPYSDVKKGTYGGVLRKVLDQFGKEKKIKFEYVDLPVSRLYAEFYNEKIDFKLPSNPYWQSDIKKKRQLNITYSAPVVSYIDGLFVKKDSKLSLDKINSLGVIAGFTPWEYLGPISKGKIKKSENPDIEGLLRQLILGRIDAAYVNVAVANYYIKNKIKKEGLVQFDKDLPHTKSSYHLSTIKHPEMIKQFNSFLKENQEFLSSINKEVEL